MIVVHWETLWSPAPQPMDDDQDDERLTDNIDYSYLESHSVE